MSKRGLAAGAAWTYGGLFLTSILQFGYAAITTRALSSGEFGAYAAALTASGLISVLANAGLAQSVSRMTEEDRGVIAALSVYALLVGATASMVLVLIADPWARLWGAPEAAPVVAALGLAAFFSPVTAVASGLLRRSGRFAALSIALLTSNVAGMILGAIAVIVTRRGEALVVFAIVAQMSSAAITVTLVRGTMFGRPSWRRASGDLGFSGKAVVSSLLSWGVGSLPAFGISRGLGSSVLGQWNRAEVLTSIPFQQVQSAITTPLYPELRHDRNDSVRAARVWGDLFTATSWIAYPAGAVLAAVGPWASHVLFGDGWQLTAALVPVLAVIGALQVTSTVLGVAVEVLGRFRIIYAVQVIGLATQAAAAVAMIGMAEIWPGVVGLVALNILRQCIYASYLGRLGYIRTSNVLARQLRVIFFAAVLWLMVSAFVSSLEAADLPAALVLGALALGCGVLLVWRRRDVEPFVLFRRYLRR